MRHGLRTRFGFCDVYSHARLHIAYALGGQGVAAQVRVTATVIQARGLREFLEHADHTLRLKSGICHDRITQAVSFALHVS